MGSTCPIAESSAWVYVRGCTVRLRIPLKSRSCMESPWRAPTIRKHFVPGRSVEAGPHQRQECAQDVAFTHVVARWSAIGKAKAIEEWIRRR